MHRLFSGWIGMRDVHQCRPNIHECLINPKFILSHGLEFLFVVICLSLGVTVVLCIKSSSPNTYSTNIFTHYTTLPLRYEDQQEYTLLLSIRDLQPLLQETQFVNSNDEELFWEPKTIPRTEKFLQEGVSKVAFMFLAKGSLPLAPLWEMFFRGNEGLYTIYLHSHPLYSKSIPEDSVFHGRRIPSMPVEWGRSSMVDAERRLLASALLDLSNERFILLSESCIPLFNFTTIYSYLINSDQSFLNSFHRQDRDTKGRYNPRMQPAINITDWRKGSQWFEVTRDVAINIVSDHKYYRVFREFCTRESSPPCYMDEHYFPTLSNIVSPGRNSNRTITWVDWSKRGSHPRKFRKGDVSLVFIDKIRFGRYNCTYNGIPTAMCFLFARKFMPDTLRPLMQIAPKFLSINS